jgi:hypothetical protein
MKRIAWGCSKLLRFYLENTGDRDWAYVIDNYAKAPSFCSLHVKSSEALVAEDRNDVRIYIFAVANDSLVAIIALLSAMGYRLGQNVFLYSDLYADGFVDAVKQQLGWDVDRDLLSYAASYTLNSRKPVHTTICGTWLFLEALRRLGHSKGVVAKGAVAEVGAYEGGNVLCALHSPVWSKRPYYVFDSFEGFPDMSAEDPATFGRGDYKPQKSIGEILAPLSLIDSVKVIRGFVPGTFKSLPSDEVFSLVFYDCDLYQPALDTYEYFWDKLPSGGMLLIHDYFAPPEGFTGVKTATDSFFGQKECRFAAFWQTTMAVAVKP